MKLHYQANRKEAKKQIMEEKKRNENKHTPLTINSPLIFCTSALTLLVISN